jgi:anti-sigma factor NepR-like protein
MSSACCIHPRLFDGSLMGGSKGENSKTHEPAGLATVIHRVKATEPGRSPADLDRWLNEKLRMLYGPVLSEPIPDDLARLIELHRRDNQD